MGMLTLSDIFAFFQLTHIDNLAIDCEGCEYTVFTSLSWKALHRSVYEISGEYGNYHFSSYMDLYNVYEDFAKGGWRCEEEPKFCTPEGVDIFLPNRSSSGNS